MNKNIAKKMGAGLLAGAIMLMCPILMAGCSEDGGKVAGGVAEETGIAQGTVQLAGSVQIMGRILELDSNNQNLEVDVTAVPFNVGDVKFCKLDSKTFEETAECVAAKMSNGTEYELKTEGFKWHYGLLSVSGHWDDERQVSYYAIIDVEDSLATNVNALTAWKYHQAKSLVEAGVEIPDAMNLAEEKILETLGVYGEYEPFGKMILSGTTASDALLIAATYLLNGKTSEYDDFRDVAITMLQKEVRRNLIHSPVFWEMMGIKEPEDAFKDLVEQYVIDYLAKHFNLGRCEGENEGRILDGSNYNFGVLKQDLDSYFLRLECKDGAWSWYKAEVEHVIGSMTDPRDGRVYKTTSVKVEGKTQTWMAEDLKYEAPWAVCLPDTVHTCEEPGVYSWTDLMHLDTAGYWGIDSALIAEDEEVKQCVDSLLSHYNEWAYEDGVLKYDSLAAYKNCMASTFDSKGLLESVDVQNHQGVCPDGWRIPSTMDWKLLVEAFEGGRDIAGMMLMKNNIWKDKLFVVHADTGHVTEREIRRTYDAIEFAAVPNTRTGRKGLYASIPDYEESDERQPMGGMFVLFSSSRSGISGGYWDFDGDYDAFGNTVSPTMMAVRCIKAD